MHEAFDLLTFNGAAGEIILLVGAEIVDGIELTVEVDDRDRLATDDDLLRRPGSNLIGARDSLKFFHQSRKPLFELP